MNVNLWADLKLTSAAMSFNLGELKNSQACSAKPQPDLYDTIDPFLGPNITKNTRANMYIGVKKKLTNQQPLTNKDIKSSLSTWNSRNSLPKNPAL